MVLWFWVYGVAATERLYIPGLAVKLLITCFNVARSEMQCDKNIDIDVDCFVKSSCTQAMLPFFNFLK